MFSTLALKIYTAIRNGAIKSRTMFWRDFSSIDKINSLNLDCSKYEHEITGGNFEITCCFDDNFPKIDECVPRDEKPFLFIYKGDLDLLKNISKNVAVVGVLTPNQNIAEREIKIVSKLVKNDICIISGLAKGCDTIAHKACIEHGGKTVAFLPSPINAIYPSENISLSKSIIKNGGLIITEYTAAPKTYKENIARLIERDRLQALFASSVILIASYRKGEGDSGSRHAMLKAKRYGRKRFVMLNNITDTDNPIFGLNEDLIKDDVKVLTPSKIIDICN